MRRVLLEEFLNLLRIGTSRVVDEYSSGSYRQSFRRRNKSKSSDPSPRKAPHPQATPHQENIGKYGTL